MGSHANLKCCRALKRTSMVLYGTGALHNYARWQASPALYAANIAPKIQVSTNIMYRQHDEKTVGTICRSLIPPINLIIDRIGGPSIRHRRFVLIVVCVLWFFSSMLDFVFFEFLRRNWYENMRTTFWQKRPPRPTQINDHNFVKNKNQSKSFWEQLRRCI